jgi:uncharacterized protein
MKKHLVRMLLFFAGLTFSAMGVTCILRGSNLGMDPWDVLFYGLSKQVHLSFGTCVQAIGAVCLFSTILYTKRAPKIGTWITLILYGRIIDFFSKSALIPPSYSLYYDLLYVGLGIIAVGFGSGMYISAKWGAGPIDGFTLMLSSLIKINLGKTYVLLAILVAAIGYILGGPFSFCTIVYSFAVGPMVQLSYKFFKRIEFVQRNRIKMIIAK